MPVYSRMRARAKQSCFETEAAGADGWGRGVVLEVAFSTDLEAWHGVLAIGYTNGDHDCGSGFPGVGSGLILLWQLPPESRHTGIDP